jgi:hypothetical protein
MRRVPNSNKTIFRTALIKCNFTQHAYTRLERRIPANQSTPREDGRGAEQRQEVPGGGLPRAAGSGQERVLRRAEVVVLDRPRRRPRHRAVALGRRRKVVAVARRRRWTMGPSAAAGRGACAERRHHRAAARSRAHGGAMRERESACCDERDKGWW